MRPSKQLIFGTIGLVAAGAIRDIVNVEDEHTVPRVPLSVSASGALAATTTSYTAAAIYVSNMTTGDEYRVPPRDHREYVGYFAAPADKYIYVVGKTRG